MLEVYKALDIEGMDVTETLRRDIHTIAYFYHWGESAILALPILKRRDYIELIRGQVEAENSDGEGNGTE